MVSGARYMYLAMVIFWLALTIGLQASQLVRRPPVEAA